MIRYFRLLSILLTLTVVVSCGTSKRLVKESHVESPKHEFRGAWIQTVFQSRYQQMNSAEMKRYIIDMVSKLDDAGINAVIFQVRPEADAFYKSSLEPWSRYLTGQQGLAPDDPSFDPLEFIIDECHKRGMELHAWLNPYRARAGAGSQLSANHIYWRHPERFVQYGTQIFFDPGLPENRGYICDVVHDIVSRYDVDAIHMDDYFYPYPIAGEPFPDDNSFFRYAESQGFGSSQRDDWRRNNVNMLIQELKYTIASAKPWVRFGISPFGIYRNKRSHPEGSNTNGLQNYDDLFADVKLWVQKGWIDYNMPQIYWENGHAAADYTTLLHWWHENNFKQPLYIGQDIKRSTDRNELQTKISQSRQLPNVHGNSYWYGYQILDNAENSTEILKRDINRNKALIPAYTHMHKGKPTKVKGLKQVFTEDLHLLMWDKPKDEYSPESAHMYVIYRFSQGESININHPENIISVTSDNFFVLPYEGGDRKYTYVVTALDAFKNEGKVAKIKVKL